MSLPVAELRAMVGRTATYTAPEELGRAAIRMFAVAVGDTNPLYTDREFARAWGYDDVVAPPTLLCETNQYAGLPADADGYAGHTWGIDIPGTRKVRGGNAYTFHKAVHPDDVVTACWTLTDVAERRMSSGLAMVIVSSVATYSNQRGELLVTNEETVIWTELPGPKKAARNSATTGSATSGSATTGSGTTKAAT
ncbi:FAS1-like dehydratase domain-containing protein [Streptodolium elevatio]|uniref:MaoC family dehydratase N-terminal domain-containing protein n=1 Tax=Streptodolium elevatio TaxID=3157996 RepID=A0ABV3D8E1_9ACTN